MADDTGLEVDALDGAPGRALGPLRRRGRHLRRQRGQAARRRSTGVSRPTATRPVPHRRPGPLARRARGRRPRAWSTGTIATGGPRATAGFGYDPVFVPDEGDGRTFAEMTADEKHAVSHRGRAFRCSLAAPGSSRPFMEPSAPSRHFDLAEGSDLAPVDDGVLAVDRLGDAADLPPAELLVEGPRRVRHEHEVELHGVEADGRAPG